MNKFVITGYSRTGSSYLMRMLMSHPNIYCNGEIFNAHPHPRNPYCKILSTVQPIAYLESCLQVQEIQKTHCGFKLLGRQARQKPLDSIWEYLKSQKFSILMTTRRNLLNRYLSEQLVWRHSTPDKHAWSDVIFEKPVNIDPEKFIRDAQYHINQEQWLLKHFSKNPLFKMEYEDLHPTEESYGRILGFLGLQWIEPNTNMKKQRQKTQQKMIQNYWELKKALENTKYAIFFDEEEV